MADKILVKTPSGFANYKVKSNGVVIGARGKPLLFDKTNRGYLRVTLCCNGKTKRFSLHRLVASLFCVKPKGCNVVNHKNGIKGDCRAINLEWTTNKGNVNHCIRTGLQKLNGENNPSAKLTQKQVNKIKLLRHSGISSYRIAERFNVSRPLINNIWNNKNWKHGSI